MYDVIIIGAGVSGLTAAIYGLRANMNILILESKSYGGQILNASLVENYPGISKISGFDLATNLYNQVVELGGKITYEEVVKVTQSKEVITKNNKYIGKNIIIATGCSYKKLGLENEDRLIGRGISYCATCDGNFYKNKDVAIIGGGNTALEDAIYLSNIANKVYLIHRRDSFKGEAKYVDELNNKDNVICLLNSEVNKINGDTMLESIDVISNKKISNIKVDGLFIAIGQLPSNLLVDGLLDVDNYGYIKSDDTKTYVDGIYVSGDVRTKNIRQLTTACADGTISMMNIINESLNK